MEASLDYISVGVNRVVNALAWGEHGGVAYAAHHMVTLYDVESAKVACTLAGHTGMVNCVLWLSAEDTPELPPHQHILVSGAADNTIRVWLVSYSDGGGSGGGGGGGGGAASGGGGGAQQGQSAPATAAPKWSCLAVLEGHSGPVTSLAALRLAAAAAPAVAATGEAAAAPTVAVAAAAALPRLLLVSTAGDADVIVWGCSCAAAAGGSDSSADAAGTPQPPPPAQPAWAATAAGCYGPGCWCEDQRIHVGGGGANKMVMATSAALTPLPLDPEWTLLALGGTDRRVTLHIRPPAAATAVAPAAPAVAGVESQQQQPQRPRFVPACALEGHENWVRGVAFCVIDGGSSSSSSSGGGGSSTPKAAAGGETAGPHLLLASVSQDRYGRIWKLQPEPLQRAATAAAGATAAACCEDPLAVLIQRYAPKPHVDTDTHRYVASSEALLIGHEDWVHGLQWAPPPPPATAATAAAGAATAGGLRRGRSHTRATAALLTASMDRTMIIWRYEAGSGLWMNEAALGDAGASCLGYFGGVWSPRPAAAAAAGRQQQRQRQGQSAILAHGFTGALHLWRQEGAPCDPHPTATSAAPSPSSSFSAAHWRPRHALGGHFGGVVDLAWGLDGGCVISVSEDQTARVHTATVWREQQQGQQQGEREQEGEQQGQEEQEEEEEEGEQGEGERKQQEGGRQEGGEGEQLHWCEVARSQIHGHDFRCVAHVPTAAGGSGSGSEPGHLTYVSGAEEKVLRVFEAPQAFIDTLVALRGGDATTSSTTTTSSSSDTALSALRRRRGLGFGAAVAALGLSQKAVYEEEEAAAAGGGGAGAAEGGGGAGGGGGGDYADGPDFVPYAAPHVVREPPLEEHLAQNTLWPETHKLYGHGNELWAAAASPCGRFLASACKAQTASTAAVWVWCTRTWRALAQLRAHTLTVTQLAWSPSGARLAAGSRDRTFSIFQRVDRKKGQQQEGEKEGEKQGGKQGEGEEEVGFELLCRAKGAHGRVIWSVCWSHDERLVATAARDDTVKVWRLVSEPAAAAPGGVAVSPVLAAALPQFPCAATAVAFAPTAAVGSSAAGGAASYHLAVGLEDGSLQLWQLDPAAATAVDGGGGLTATCLWAAPPAWRHVAPVRRLAWRGAPGTGALEEGTAAALAVGGGGVNGGGGGGGAAQLASGSEDHSVRVFSFRFA